MSDTVAFNAESRALVGKGAARATRRNGRVPAVIYGANKDPEPISIDPAQLRSARMQSGFFATLFDIKSKETTSRSCAAICSCTRSPTGPCMLTSCASQNPRV